MSNTQYLVVIWGKNTPHTNFFARLYLFEFLVFTLPTRRGSLFGAVQSNIFLLKTKAEFVSQQLSLAVELQLPKPKHSPLGHTTPHTSLVSPPLLSRGSFNFPDQCTMDLRR